MNRQDLKKLLEELSSDLSKSISDVKQDLVQAKSLHTKVSNYVSETQASLDKFNDENSGLMATLDSAKNIESEINTLKTNADTHLQSITDNLSAIQPHITEMESAYTQFVAVNTQINDGELGLEAILTNSKSIRADIEATKGTTETIFKEISKLKDTASSYTSDIGKLNKTAKETVEKITRNHEESEDIKKKMSEIFNISSRTTHANYFHERQQTLKKTYIAWLIGFVGMLAITIWLSDKYISPLIEVINNGQQGQISDIKIEVVLIRLGLVTPAILAAFYCLNQFGRERRLHEQYAFKAISMLSIESSLELLARSLAKNTCEERDSQVSIFAVKTLESVYKDPLDYEKRSLLFRGGNKILEVSAEINESVGEIKNDLDKLSDNIKVK